MLKTNEDLFEFLYQWHRAWPGELGLPEYIIPEEVPCVLRRAYSAIGRLTRRESEFNPGPQRGRPLGTQDALLEPEELTVEMDSSGSCAKIRQCGVASSHPARTTRKSSVMPEEESQLQLVAS